MIPVRAIRILNKNSNNYYYVDEAPVATEVKNETLDSGTFVISNLLEKIEIEPYDIIDLLDTNLNHIKYMCVDTYTETLQCVNPRIYRYEISTFSETKQLENTILPNLKITKMPGITRSIYDYINQYMDEYCPKVRIDTSESISGFTVNNTIIQVDGSNRYSRVVVKKQTTEAEAPTKESIRVSASVTWIYQGQSTTVNEQNCEVLSSFISDGEWFVIFRVFLTTGDVDSTTLNSFEVFEKQYEFRPLYDWTYDNNNNDTADLEELFSDQCPEMQWNTPTLREVLNDLMMVKDCIPTIVDGKLVAMDLTTVNDKDWSDDNSHINYVTRSKSSEDYVSELQVDLQNVTNSDGSYVTRVEYVPFMTDENQVALKDSNAFVKTKYPIYRLRSLKMIFPGKYNRTAGSTEPYEVIDWMEYDLCTVPGLVCEYQEWITKPIEYLITPPSILSDFGNHQNWSLYYTRGDNKITNFFNKTTIFLWVSESLLESLTKAIAKAKTSDISDARDWKSLESDVYYKAMFKVEYETLQGCLFRASKGDYPEHDRVVIDNQTNSYVDGYNQGFLEYQKANRLGNEQLHINARFENNETLMQIGDTFDDCVIYQCQYQFFKDHTEVNALATKNYILREYFTGVKSKIRSWAIVSGSEALTRHDIKKNYFEFSYRKYELMDRDIYFEVTYFVTPFITYTAEPIIYAAIQNYSTRDHVIPNAYKSFSTYYVVDLISRIVGNSIVITFGFEDNYSVGKSVDTDEINLDNTSIDYAGTVDWARTVDVGGIPVKPYRYTDDIGEFDWCEASFCSNIKIIPRTTTTVYDDPVDMEYINPSDDNEERRRYVFYGFLRPRIIESSFYDQSQGMRYVHFYHRFTHHKDSQEIPILSTQIEFCSENNDICVGKEFIKRQKAVSQKNNSTSNYLLITYPSSAHDFRHPDDLPSVQWTNRYSVKMGYSQPIDSLNTQLFFALSGWTSYDTPEEADAESRRIANNQCFYLYDDTTGSKGVILSFNNVPEINCYHAAIEVAGVTRYYPCYVLTLNVLRSRNKNIYDENNHYLIVDKI